MYSFFIKSTDIRQINTILTRAGIRATITLETWNEKRPQKNATREVSGILITVQDADRHAADQCFQGYFKLLMGPANKIDLS